MNERDRFDRWLTEYATNAVLMELILAKDGARLIEAFWECWQEAQFANAYCTHHRWIDSVCRNCGLKES